MALQAQSRPDEVTWENLIPPEQWSVYACILHQACQEQIPFALGGGLALGYYTGTLYRSKDLDIYISPEHKDRLIAMMDRCGMADYFDVQEYDRGWIYRGHSQGVIVDAIWSMANRRTVVDEIWTSAGPMVQLCGESFRVIPAEELLWSKLYVLQRDRCDWPDLLNLLSCTGPRLDWQHLAARVAEDRPLLKALMAVFAWVNPDRAMVIPRRVWEAFELPLPFASGDPAGRPSRKDLLDTRPWLFPPDTGTQCAA